MARLLPILIFLIFNSLILISSETLTSFKPKQLVLPVRKDQATNLFTTTIKTRIPSVALPFVVHLNGKFLWVNCDAKYRSLTYKAPNCRSTECAKASGTATTCFTCSSIERPGCHKESCALMPMNPVTHETSMGELGQDVLSIQTTKGSSPGQFVSVPQFLFSCASSSLLQNGLPGNVEGVAGLGHFPISIPTQLASRFGFAPKFAICLPSTTSSSGAVFFGDGPYYLRPGNLDVSRGLTYTPVTISPTGKYYIQVTEIRINKKPVPVNPGLLTMNKKGRRGTRFSTTKPFGILEHSIFQSVTRAFAREFDAIRVKAVAPFGLCYEFQTDRNVASVPEIEFVLQNQNVKWTILGANSMVQVQQGVSCFAFIDGGEKHKAAIIIGAHQLQDNLLQFDLAKSNLGFSPRSTTCDFKFNPESTP